MDLERKESGSMFLRLALIRLSWLLPVLLLSAAGCASLQGSSEPQGVAPLAAPPEAKVTLELRTSGGRGERTEIPLRTGLLVSEALTETGAMRQFLRKEVHVDRRLPDGQLLRLQVHLSSTHRAVEPAFDYELHPGDRLVIQEVTGSVLGEMLERVVPLGLLRR